MSKELYTIKDLIAELSNLDQDAPVLVAYWTPDIFDLTNEEFAQFIEDNNGEEEILNLSVTNEELFDWIAEWKADDEEVE